MTTSSQELKQFLDPYTKEELAQLVITRAQNNSAFHDSLLELVKTDKKWCKLFVHGLSYSTTNETLHDYYSKFGNVVEAVVLMDKKGQSKGYGFVTFSNADEALNAVKIERKKIDGRTTHCNLAFKGNPKKWQNGSGGSYNPTSLPGTRPSDSNRDERRLFVHSLAWKTDDEALARQFRSYGELEEAVVIRDKNTSKSKGYGFVTFRFAESARAALRHPEKEIDGRQTKCNLACERANTLSSLAAVAATAAYSGFSLPPPQSQLSQPQPPTQQQPPMLNGLQRSHSDPLTMTDNSMNATPEMVPVPPMHKSQSTPSQVVITGASGIQQPHESMFYPQPHQLFVQPVTNIPFIPFQGSHVGTTFIPAPSVSSGSTPISPPPPVYSLSSPGCRPQSANSSYGVPTQSVLVTNQPYNTVLTNVSVNGEMSRTLKPHHQHHPGTTIITTAANLQGARTGGLIFPNGRSSPLTQRSHSPVPGSPKSQPDENPDREGNDGIQKTGV